MPEEKIDLKKHKEAFKIDSLEQEIKQELSEEHKHYINRAKEIKKLIEKI